ncbi:MAG: DUF1800 domain-containing protein [Rhodospirillaceae bacterium]|nr:DUF1800 domain-containing protein [Rhodospirillaceae bacterium]
MLRSAPSFETLALNRVTFGARDADVAAVQKAGWTAWVDEQLNPPSGDDPALAAFMAGQTMRIMYNGQPPTQGIVGWPTINQLRPLNYMNADISALWDLARNVEYSVAANELSRVQQEICAATWIRNTHAAFQIREFMVDFWNNHFNIGRQADIFASVALPVYDTKVIRPRALGNFRDLLEAVATSTAMLRYLNNAESTAALPNENYAREIMELHTLGRAAYIGLGSAGAGIFPLRRGILAAGFTDQDIIEASRALSGWTVEQGQAGPGGELPNTGRFVYNPLQHNTQARSVLGVDISHLTDPMQQGKAVLDILAEHPATAEFICIKLAKRMFGDTPPPAVIARAKQAWLANRNKPDQIKTVLAAILQDGAEIGLPLTASSKLRRPYERIIAFFRTTGTVVNAFDLASSAATALGDGLYVWPTPEGRPDTDAQWLTTSANLYNWNLPLLLLAQTAFRTTLGMQTPSSASASPTLLVEYWVERMVGYTLRPPAMSALIEDAAGPVGAMAAYASGGVLNIENALRRLTALIATSPEFGLR